MREFVLQDSPAWLSSRVGCLTASRVYDATAKLKKGEYSSSRRTLMLELLTERITGFAKDHFVTPAMQWGLDHEAAAADLYEAETGNLVVPAGLVMHQEIEFFGATPDRFVGEHGAIEVKCPTTQGFLDFAIRGIIPDPHLVQINSQMSCCEWLEWIDYVVYDPRVSKRRNPLIIQRVSRDHIAIAEIESEASKFLGELDQMFDTATEMRMDVNI